MVSNCVQTEKVDLENTVVDESQRQLKDVGASRSKQDKYSGKHASAYGNYFRVT